MFDKINHPNHMFSVDVEYWLTNSKDVVVRNNQTHSLIFTDGNVAISIYEDQYFFWNLNHNLGYDIRGQFIDFKLNTTSLKNCRSGEYNLDCIDGEERETKMLTKYGMTVRVIYKDDARYTEMYTWLKTNINPSLFAEKENETMAVLSNMLDKMFCSVFKIDYYDHVSTVETLAVLNYKLGK